MGRISQDQAHLKALGRRVATLRKSRGLTQAQVAERAGMTIRYISMIETGRRNPTYLVLGDLARGLRTPTKALIP